MKICRIIVAGAILTLLFCRTTAAASPGDLIFISLESPSPFDSSEGAPHISAEKTGSFPTTEGMLLQVKADPGNIHIFTDETSRVSYQVRIEADSREPGAEEFIHRLTVAARSTSSGISLDGSIPVRTFRGQFTISYEIHIPRRYNIEVRTLGGNIDLQDIEGRVNLFTDGGNISAGRVGAEEIPSHSPHSESVAAKLETRGGHVTIGDVSGTLQATTSGGHITAGNVAGDAVLHTGGGQIWSGRISGIATLDTGGGNVTAWLNDDARVAPDSSSGHKPIGASQLSSSEGDIVVFLPREMAATIDAVIGQNGGHRIIADSSLPLTISDGNSTSGSRTIRFEGDLNGGGRVVHLRAASGNILLRSAESRMERSAASPATWRQAGSASFQSSNFNAAEDFDDAEGFFAGMRRRILESWWGAVPVDAVEMQKHLEHSVAPVYPQVARRAGVEGDVVLRIYVSTEGRVTDLKVLDGPPILARAAAEAVQQWQYQPHRMNGQPANAVTTLIVSFRLH